MKKNKKIIKKMLKLKNYIADGIYKEYLYYFVHNKKFCIDGDTLK
jgi:hypothetical protein